ncbi:MAG: hypothetical protein ACK5RO_13200 [Pseudobdellovibrionaceae bacterium]|jgi:hypothetical protein
MRIFILALTILSASISQAWTMTSKNTKAADGSYFQKHTYLCDFEDQNFCRDLCGDPLVCERVENDCTSCAGSSSQFLRTLFTRADQYYTANPTVLNQQELIQFLKNERYVILSPRSLYNYYRPWNSPDLQKNFLNFCPANSIEAQFIVGLDGRNIPAHFDYVLCTSENPLITIAHKVNSRTNQPLSLTLSTELSEVSNSKNKLEDQLTINNPSQRGQIGEIP